jgi:N,N'-diacetyllegionaminate synthase
MKKDIYVIAEVGSVHDGSFGNAQKLVELAADCGADAIKFQTHIAESETLREAPSPAYFSTEPRYEYFERTSFKLEQWKALIGVASQNKIEFLSSPFSCAAVDLLEEAGVNRYKIPSGEVNNHLMLRKIAATRKPVLLSSGMSSWEELDQAVDIFTEAGCELTVMQCSSMYPCPNNYVGLNVINDMKKRWGLPVGFSDHTRENFACFASAALGVSAIEKHLTFSRDMYGSDAKNSAEPPQFRDLVKGVKAILDMTNTSVDKNDISPYIDMKSIFEKSVVASTFISAGTIITSEMLTVKKPGSGIKASRMNDVIGKRAISDIQQDSMIQCENIA